LVRVLSISVMAACLSGCAKPTQRRIDIDPRADEALRKMSTAIGGAKAVSFQAGTTMDEPIETGQLAQFTRDNRIVVRRPNCLFAEACQNEDALSLWYDGRTVTLLDKTSNQYAAFAAPGGIDAMLDDVAHKHGLTVPLADLLLADAYKSLTDEALTGRYVGQNEVEGVKCHHLLFTQELIDWQLWIDAGEKPLPHKFVIDYKAMPGRPQFTAVLTDWNLSATTKDDAFKAAIPGGAKKVDMPQVLKAEGGK
jgi:hypothetical protein